MIIKLGIIINKFMFFKIINFFISSFIPLFGTIIRISVVLGIIYGFLHISIFGNVTRHPG